MMKMVVLKDGSSYKIPMTKEEADKERERERLLASHDEAQALWNARCKGAREWLEEVALSDSEKYGISIGESIVNDAMQAYKAAHSMRKDEIVAARETYYKSVKRLLVAEKDAIIAELRAKLGEK